MMDLQGGGSVGLEYQDSDRRWVWLLQHNPQSRRACEDTRNGEWNESWIAKEGGTDGRKQENVVEVPETGHAEGSAGVQAIVSEIETVKGRTRTGV